MGLTAPSISVPLQREHTGRGSLTHFRPHEPQLIMMCSFTAVAGP